MEKDEKKHIAEDELMEENHENKLKDFINGVLVNIIDQFAMLIISLIILIVFNFLIGFAGYRVVMPIPVLFIIYFIVGCLYISLLKNTKWKKTIGQKVMHIN